MGRVGWAGGRPPRAARAARGEGFTRPPCQLPPKPPAAREPRSGGQWQGGRRHGAGGQGGRVWQNYTLTTLTYIVNYEANRTLNGEGENPRNTLRGLMDTASVVIFFTFVMLIYICILTFVTLIYICNCQMLNTFTNVKPPEQL